MTANTAATVAPTRIESFCTSGTSPTDFTLTGPDDGPVVLLLGGISAPADPSWWSDLIGPDRALDTDRLRLLSVGFEGLSTHQQADRILALLDELGIDRLHTAIGCSYGGMVCLALAARAPERFGRLVVVGAAHRPHALASGWRLVQRRILALTERLGAPEEGVALARMLAMTTYRTDRELDARFDQDGLVSWLDHHGERYAETVSTERFARLSLAIDQHHVDPAELTVPLTLVGFDTDLLAPPWLLEELADQAAGPVDLRVLPSLHGHDAFLLEPDALGTLLTEVLADGEVSR